MCKLSYLHTAYAEAGMPFCRHVLKDDSEHAMVRHEAAEALGSIASPDCLQLLTDYCQDADSIVADSCVVSILALPCYFTGVHPPVM